MMEYASTNKSARRSKRRALLYAGYCLVKKSCHFCDRILHWKRYCVLIEIVIRGFTALSGGFNRVRGGFKFQRGFK